MDTTIREITRAAADRFNCHQAKATPTIEIPSGEHERFDYEELRRFCVELVEEDGSLDDGVRLEELDIADQKDDERREDYALEDESVRGESDERVKV